MDPRIVECYRKRRAQEYSAVSALRQARDRIAYEDEHEHYIAEVKAWNPSYDEDLRIDQPDGPQYALRIHVEDDYDSGPDGRFTDTWSKDCVEVARILGPDEWPTEGRDRRPRYYERVTGNYESDRRWLIEHNYRKADADLLARRYEREDVKHAVEYAALTLTVEARIGATVLGTASIGGMDYDPGDVFTESYREWIRETAVEMIDEAIFYADETLDALAEVREASHV